MTYCVYTIWNEKPMLQARLDADGLRDLYGADFMAVDTAIAERGHFLHNPDGQKTFYILPSGADPSVIPSVS